ncbi:MAG: YaiO family outer membrane beta-barrel protein [Thermaurantimonas sp.]
MKIMLIILMGAFQYLITNAQDRIADPDSLLKESAIEARTRNYKKARNLIRDAVLKYPDYKDLQFAFLNYLYWDGASDSTLKMVDSLIDKYPEEYQLYKIGINTCYTIDSTCYHHYNSRAIRQFPDSAAVLTGSTARYLHDKKRYKASAEMADSALKMTNPDSTLTDLIFHYRITENYQLAGGGYMYYWIGADPLFPRHQFYLEYQNKSDFGIVIPRFHLASRFGVQSWMGEVEFYPKFGRNNYFYGLISFADGVLFPFWRIAAEPFFVTNNNVELSVGWRYVDFGELKVHSLTGSLGRYWGNHYASARIIYTPFGDLGANISGVVSYKYFLDNPLHFIDLKAGYGVSPESEYLDFNLAGTIFTRALRFSAGYQFWLEKSFLIRLTGYYEQVDPSPKAPFNVYGILGSILFLL